MEDRSSSIESSLSAHALPLQQLEKTADNFQASFSNDQENQSKTTPVLLKSNHRKIEKIYLYFIGTAVHILSARIAK